MLIYIALIDIFRFHPIDVDYFACCILACDGLNIERGEDRELCVSDFVLEKSTTLNEKLVRSVTAGY